MSYIGHSGWNDYTISALSLPLAHATAPTLTLFRDGLYLPAFTGTGGSTKEVYISIHILHTYKMETLIYPHIHWTHIIGSPSGNVVWGIEYSVAKGHTQQAYPASTTVTVTQAAGSQYWHHLVEVSDDQAIPSTNIEPDSVVIFRVFRDPTDSGDTFANNAYMITFDMHIKEDGYLTNEKVSPFTKRVGPSI